MLFARNTSKKNTTLKLCATSFRARYLVNISDRAIKYYIRNRFEFFYTLVITYKLLNAMRTVNNVSAHGIKTS